MRPSCPQRCVCPSMHLTALGSRLTNARTAYLTPTDHRMPLTTERCGISTLQRRCLQATASEDQPGALGAGAEVKTHYSYSSLHVDLTSETGEIRVWPAVDLSPSPPPLCKRGALHCLQWEPVQAGLLELQAPTLELQGHLVVLRSQTPVSFIP